MAAKAKVVGLDELIKKLNSLGTHEAVQRISFRATFGAAKDLRELARTYAPQGHGETPGELKRGFAIKRIQYGTRRGYTVGVRAGRTRDKRSTDDPFYWWWQEFGTRNTTGKGYFRRAFLELRTRAGQNIIASGRKAVLDSGNRALARYGSGKK